MHSFVNLVLHITGNVAQIYNINSFARNIVKKIYHFDFRCTINH